jgi:hypothetical protein
MVLKGRGFQPRRKKPEKTRASAPEGRALGPQLIYETSSRKFATEGRTDRMLLTFQGLS